LVISREALKGGLAVFLLRFFSFFPFSVLQVMGTWLGSLSYALNSRSRRVVEANLRHCFPQWSEDRRQALVRQTMRESGKTLFEMAGFWHWPTEKSKHLICEVHNQVLLQEALARQHGVIVLAPHLGNWELAGIYLARQAPITCLYAPAKLPAMDRLMIRGRQRNGTKLAPTNMQGVKALLKALKAGEMVGILPDQVPESGSGVFAPFFGQPALTMTLLTTLARRTEAAVLCCYARRREDGRGFDMVWLPADPDIRLEDEQAAVIALNRSVEQCVLQCLEQYQWEYKRFRERPPGGGKIY
jgi:KDO2-lipid IV(A) lauroyltransferase